MTDWGMWELSYEIEDRVNKICSKLGCENSLNTSKDWSLLFNYGSAHSESNKLEMDVSDVDPKVDVISNIIKESLTSDAVIPESLFVGISVNNLSRIFVSVNAFLDDLEFCTLCKSIASWKQDILVEQSLKLIALPKLKEITEATGCIIFSVKKLAASHPLKFCENVLTPLLSDEAFQFTDAELLSGLFSVFPTAQKDLLLLTFTKKNELVEKDWFLLYPLLEDLSQSSLLNLLKCIQKFSKKFTNSQVFGRFLVKFCKTSNLTESNKEVLKEVLKNHETLLKIQALKHLESA